MKYPPLAVEFVLSRLRVDVGAGRVYWVDATKHHRSLIGAEAGCPRATHDGKRYWRVKINGKPYLRSHLIFAVATGSWPADQVDHINGDSLDDRAANLRSATQTQNAWNHRGRKRRIDLPMGVKRTSEGRYMARLAVNKKMHHLGTYPTVEQARAVYIEARRKHYGEFAGL